MFEILLLDLDDTILDFKKAERIAIAKTIGDFGVEPTDEVLHRYHVINLDHWKMLERGELNREQLGVRRFEVLFKELGIEADAQACENYYSQFLSEGDDILPGADLALESLSKKYRLFAATNSSVAVQVGRLDKTGLGKYFEQVFISEEIGVNKPDTNFFLTAFSRIPGFDKEKAVMIGDSLSSDIQGGKNAGITTVWINHRKADGSRVGPDHEIESLTQLEELLERI